jgi:hypothetical protein
VAPGLQTLGQRVAHPNSTHSFALDNTFRFIDGMTRVEEWLRLESLRDGKKRRRLSSSSQHLIWTGLTLSRPFGTVPGCAGLLLSVHFSFNRELRSARFFRKGKSALCFGLRSSDWATFFNLHTGFEDGLCNSWYASDGARTVTDVDGLSHCWQTRLRTPAETLCFTFADWSHDDCLGWKLECENGLAGNR